MSREKVFESIDNLIRTARGADDAAPERLGSLLAQASEGLPPDHTYDEMVSALQAEFQIFLASAMLYGDEDPSLDEQRGHLLGQFARLRGWILIIQNRVPEVS